ncbi:calcium-binding protein [Bacterioplanes sanyensis]|uniref:Calcium-binding protein n=1 Tax=Bacterioplanes sanyensis TaxID=1249553 RepID=A0A222FDR8_9GAMM|nr:cyclic nucleotide-binding domain-containing protein [Bacterioplanes sanyensis]ASP37235.1 calcium-binding protein [Bacterioplanes sanyensis]
MSQDVMVAPQDTTTNAPLVSRLQQFVPFDELSSDAVSELLPHFRIQQLPAKKMLFKRGQHDPDCHFLLDGGVDLADEQFHIEALDAKDDENFLALDGSHPIHRCAGITRCPCTVASVPRQYLELITTWTDLRQSYEQQDVDADSDWLETLLTSALFNRIPPANIQTLLTRFQEREVQLGEVIVREGEEGDCCYVIKQGKAIVSRGDDHQQEVLAALEHGALFGEDALISDLPRNATVTMSSAGELMVLTKEDFETLLKQPVLDYVDEHQLADLTESSDTGLVMLDVRSEREATTQPMQKAKLVPLSQLRKQLPKLSDEFIYLLPDDSRGAAAAYILNEGGLKAYIVRRADAAN